MIFLYQQDNRFANFKIQCRLTNVEIPAATITSLIRATLVNLLYGYKTRKKLYTILGWEFFFANLYR